MNPLDDVNGLLDYSDDLADPQSTSRITTQTTAPVIPAQAAVPAAEQVTPTAAPVAAPAPTPVDDELDDQDDDDDDFVDERHPMVYRLRRTVLRTVLIGGVALLAFFGVTQMGSNPLDPTTTPERVGGNAVVAPPTPEELQAATQQVETMIAQATAWQVQKDSFVGFTADGVRVAASDRVLVLSMVVDGRCYYGGVIPGQPVPVLYDETAQACTDQMITETQTSLDAQTAQIRNDNEGEALTLLSNAVETVQYYANSNFVGGKPSFEGMTTTAVEGVKIVDMSSSSVVLQARSGPECLVTEVTSDSASEPVVADCQG